MTRRDLEAELRAVLAAPMTDFQVAEMGRRYAQLRSPDHVLGPRNGATRRRQAVVLLAATAGLLLVTALAVLSASPSPDLARQAADRAAEERIAQDLGPLFTDGCLSVTEATTLIRQRLDALGLTDWAIETRAGAENSRCVSAAPVGDSRAVLLIPGMGADVARAMDRVQATLMEQCLDRDEAAALIASELGALGVTDWSIRTDGPQAVPIGQEQAVLDHVAAGCYVYSSSQSAPDGTRVYYIFGR